ncbi:MAG: PIG-L family deacetylase [Acidobacteria bacterium]|nr:PIG-L family deacetylase [Acidobacteriota bacterium]
MVRAACLCMCLASIAFAEPSERILVVSVDGADYLLAAGGTLAKAVLDGHRVTVAVIGNDEKESAGMPTQETRRANRNDALAAAEILGIEDFLFFDHKAGELGYTSSTEIREQLFGLIRHTRPTKLFIPDPYVHYTRDWDVWFGGRAAEEAWGYSGGGTFSPVLARAGLEPYSVPEVFYYAVGRPYQPREGGERNAGLEVRDIASQMIAKRMALAMLRTRNRATVVEIRRRRAAKGGKDPWPGAPEDAAAGRYMEAMADELGAAIGARHGLAYAEEFNYVGPGSPIPEFALERAVSKEGGQ